MISDQQIDTYLLLIKLLVLGRVGSGVSMLKAKMKWAVHCVTAARAPISNSLLRTNLEVGTLSTLPSIR